MRFYPVLLAAVIAASPVAALALNPQPEPPGVQAHQLNPQPEPPGVTDSTAPKKDGAVHVQHHAHVAKTTHAMRPATLTQGSDSSEKHHVATNTGHTNNNPTEKPTWAAGSDSSGPEGNSHGLGQIHASTTVQINN